jgi:hypothetical protein
MVWKTLEKHRDILFLIQSCKGPRKHEIYIKNHEKEYCVNYNMRHSG